MLDVEELPLALSGRFGLAGWFCSSEDLRSVFELLWPREAGDECELDPWAILMLNFERNGGLLGILWSLYARS